MKRIIPITIELVGIAMIGTYTAPVVGLENKSANMGAKLMAAGAI